MDDGKALAQGFSKNAWSHKRSAEHSSQGYPG
jgi:hypothetical protein